MVLKQPPVYFISIPRRANLVIDHIKPKAKPVESAAKEDVPVDMAFWQRLDDIVRQWVYGAISNDLLNSTIDLDDKKQHTSPHSPASGAPPRTQQRGLLPPPAISAGSNMGALFPPFSSPTPSHLKPPPSHSMATCSKHDIIELNPKYHDQAHHTSTFISPIPKNPVHALS
uniref:Uncharacterized protein n=1 Tax=Chenopodium quinoa TaxID=63459 RepID=A0A803KLZ3_CHEQI